MPKFVHRAKTLPAFPQDYYERWDATTSEGMVLSGSDIITWAGQCGNYTLSNYTTGTAATWAPGAATFAGTGGVGLRTELTAAAFDANPRAVFVSCTIGVASPNNGSAFAGPEAFIRLEDFSDDVQFAYNDGAANTASPTNDMNDRRLAFGYSTDLTDINWWWGANSKGTDTVTGGTFNEGLNYLYIGAANTSTATTLSGEVNEVIVYDRHLTDADAEKVLNYLSNKWSAQNEDSASTVIATASTAATWQNDNIDKAGEGTLNPPGGQPGEYSIVELGDRDAASPSSNYPADTWGSGVAWHFDAEYTAGMNFLTGSARAGGTVDSWTDLTGNLTMTLAASSATNAVNYTPKVKGRGAIHGTGTSSSLESTGSPTYSTTTGHQRVFWGVFNNAGDAASATAGVLGFQNFFIWMGQFGSYDGDIYSGQNVPVCRADGGAGNWVFPLSVQNSAEGKHICVVRVTMASATTADAEIWYGGNYLGKVVTASADIDNGNKVLVGENGASNFSAGYAWEFGCADPSSTISDAQVDGLIRWLCNKHDVDYMPDTAPMDIGLHARTDAATGTVAQTDCVRWYRSDKNLSETAWGLHPACAALHTTPATFTLKQGSTNASGLAVASGRTSTSHVGAGNQVLYDATGYNMAETTDFPAATDGASWGAVLYGDSSSTTSARFVSAGGTSLGIRWVTGAFAGSAYVGNRVNQTTGTGDAWEAFIGAHWHDDDGAGTPDGDPHERYYGSNAYFTDDAGSITSYGTLKFAVGGEVSPSNPSTSKVRECWVWKHPLSTAEVENMNKYIAWRYPDTLPCKTV